MKAGKVFGFICAASIILFCISSNDSSSSNSNSKSYSNYPSSTNTSNTYYGPRNITVTNYTCSNGVSYDNYSNYLECENKISWQTTRDKRLAECNADSSKFNCWYDEYPGTTLHWSYYTYETPSYNYSSNQGQRYGAICRDGTRSSATGRGACSHHGGVWTWLTY